MADDPSCGVVSSTPQGRKAARVRELRRVRGGSFDCSLVCLRWSRRAASYPESVSLALYRKYRPGSFAEVVGQDHVVEPLGRALAHDRVHHAYLFSGPRGCGKTSSARILARSLNCEAGPTPQPCGVCVSCVDLAPNGPGSIDVIEMDAATHGLVDDARELREKAAYAPAASRFKIYIIDEAHQLGPAAANALLKLIEEPPPHVRFVFATTEPQKIIATIRSRTHHYAFRLVAGPVLLQHLVRICELEQAAADPAALGLVVRSADGSVRDALSILGQLLAGAAEGGLTYSDAARQLGVTDAAVMNECIAALGGGDSAEMFRIVDRVVAQGHDPRRFVTDLLERLRDLIVVSAVPEGAQSGLIEGPDEFVVEIRRQASALDPAAVSRWADITSQGLSDLRGATAPRLQLELLVARLLAAPVRSVDSGVERRLDEVERKLVELGRADTALVPKSAAPPRLSQVAASATQAGGPPIRPAVTEPPSTRSPAVDSPASPRRVHAPTPARESRTDPTNNTASVSADQVKAQWPTILDRVKSDSRVAWMLVSGARPLGIDGGVITAAHPDAGSVARFRKSGHVERVAAAASTVLGCAVTVELIHDPGQPQTTTPSVGASNRAAGASGGPGASEVDDGHLEAAEVAGSADVDELTGIELIQRELGAVKITEYDEV